MVFHGMGFLSRFFLKPFAHLDSEQNYIIAPQAPSKYYLNDTYKHVGASWLTKENTQNDLKNVLNYVDGVYESEQISDSENLILLGFSQGVSIAMRWMTSRKIHCKNLILYAGGIPNELRKEDFDFADFNEMGIKIIYGDSDQYLTPERMTLEKEKIDMLFENRAEIVKFSGGHEIRPEILKNLV